MSNILSKKAMLCTLTTGAWRATRQHKEESVEENLRHGLDDQAKVSVRVTNHPALSELGKIHAAARNKVHYKLTLPSCDDGWRLVPVGLVVQHGDELREWRQKHDGAVAHFLSDYDSVRRTAPDRLNGLWKPEFFPELGEVERRFRFDVRYLPVPDDGQWQEWLNEAVSEAQGDLQERLRAALLAVAQRLGAEDAIFRDTLVSNLHEVISLVPQLNLAGDLAIETAAKAAREISTLDPNTLRLNKALRAETAKKAANILEALGGRL